MYILFMLYDIWIFRSYIDMPNYFFMCRILLCITSEISISFTYILYTGIFPFYIRRILILSKIIYSFITSMIYLNISNYYHKDYIIINFVRITLIYISYIILI